MHLPQPPSFFKTRPLLGILISILALPSCAVAATTGFNQTDNGSGSWDYNDPANWVGGTTGDINGIWDASLTLIASQIVTFGADTTLLTGLNVGYTGNFDLTFRSDGTADRTLTLGGDITIAPASNRTITFGSATANQGLNVDLGGNRTFTVSASKNLTFLNTISGGDLAVTGGGVVKLDRAGNAASSNIAVTNNSTLNFVNTSGTGSTRAASVNLQGGNLTVNGRNTTNTADAITGALTVSAPTSTGGISIITMSPGTGNAQVIASSLVRTDHAVALFQGTALGTNAIASPTASSSNISFTTAPTGLIGGAGATGTTTISILPWAVGGTGTTGAISTFVTYDAANGIRTLNTSTEFASTITDNTTSTNNVMIAASTTATINSATTVNSLFLNSGSQVAGTGTLTVTSGAVYLNSNAAGIISANLNFGTTEGVIGYAKGKVSTISGVISGSGGVTFYQPGAPVEGSGGTGVGLTGANTYTGNTTLFGRLDISNTNALPGGSRSGDLYNYGLLNVNTSFTINGLNGNGVISRTSSGSGTLTIGGNNANGNFSGTVTNIGNAGATLNIVKTGAGTQILSGASTSIASTVVNAGTLLITNTTGSGTGTGSITVASGARFGGTGLATGLVTANAADSVIVAGGVNAIGTLSLSGGLTAASGATFKFDINGASANTIDFGTGTLSIAGTAAIGFNNLGSIQTGTPYTLFAGSGDWSSVSASFVFDSPTGYALDTSYGSGNGYIFDATGHSLTVQFLSTAIPEPSSCALLAGLCGLAFVTLRRRRS